MNIALRGTQGSTAMIQANDIEPFTQRSYWDICQESFLKGVPHVIGRTEIKDTHTYTYYDARQLCKFLFELVISKDGKKVRMKNTQNPVDDKKIEDIVFYEVRPDSPGTADVLGTKKDFLESSQFRARIFNRNDPFDALSISFVFKDQSPLRIRKKMLVPLLVLLLVVFIVLTGCTITLMRSNKLIRGDKRK